MPIGPALRRLLGPAEPLIATLYRSAFFDVGAFVRVVRDSVDHGRVARILDVGCGEGQVTQALSEAFPRADVVGIDTSPAVGRMYAFRPIRPGGAEPGPARPASFRAVRIDDVVDEYAGRFDLVTVCDVIHHVPVAERVTFLSHVSRTVAPRGHLIVKDWRRTLTPVHLAGYLSDRLITGDRVRFCSGAELRELVARVLPVSRETSVGPWANNVVLIAARPQLP